MSESAPQPLIKTFTTADPNRLSPRLSPPATFRPDPRLHSHPFRPDPQRPAQCMDCFMGTGAHSRMVLKLPEFAEEAGTGTGTGTVSKAAVRRLLSKAKDLLGLTVIGDPAPTAVTFAVTKSRAEDRYTLGPVYMPGQVDAHGEFVTSEDLQKAVWDYVADTGPDRTVFLQHTSKPAGKWVEIMSWPHDVTVTKRVAKSRRTVTTTFPAGTAYMGVIWEPWAWEMVKAGKLTGYSMGGMAHRVEAEVTKDLGDQFGGSGRRSGGVAGTPASATSPLSKHGSKGEPGYPHPTSGRGHTTPVPRTTTLSQSTGTTDTRTVTMAEMVDSVGGIGARIEVAPPETGLTPLGDRKAPPHPRTTGTLVSTRDGQLHVKVDGSNTVRVFAPSQVGAVRRLMKTTPQDEVSPARSDIANQREVSRRDRASRGLPPASFDDEARRRDLLARARATLESRTSNPRLALAKDLIAKHGNKGEPGYPHVGAATRLGRGKATTDTPRSQLCARCQGTGSISRGGLRVTCPVCKGTGLKKSSVAKHGSPDRPGYHLLHPNSATGRSQMRAKSVEGAHAEAEAAEAIGGEFGSGHGLTPMEDRKGNMVPQLSDTQMALRKAYWEAQTQGDDAEYRMGGPHDTMTQFSHVLTLEGGPRGSAGERVWDPERAVLHDELINEVLEEALARDVPTGREAVMMGGLGGAGKTQIQSKAHWEEAVGRGADEFLVINPDNFKEMLAKRGKVPVIPGLTPMESAHLVHEESSYLAERLAAEASSAGFNVIWDFTLGSSGSGSKKLANLEADAYHKFTGVFVDVSVDFSKNSARGRWKGGVEKYLRGEDYDASDGAHLVGSPHRGGRPVPDFIIELSRPKGRSQYRSKNRSAFHELVDAGKFDRALVFNNDLPGRPYAGVLEFDTTGQEP